MNKNEEVLIFKEKNRKNEKIKKGNIENVNITFIRFFVCVLILLSILFVKKSNNELYQKFRNMYLSNNYEIIKGEVIINQLSFWLSSLWEFLKIWTFKILRSVTS